MEQSLVNKEVSKTELTLKAALALSRRVVHLVSTKKHLDFHKLWVCYEKYKETQEWEKVVRDYRERSEDFDLGSKDIYTIIEWMAATKDRWENI